MTDLVLEVNDRGFSNKDKGILANGAIMITPALDEDYWYFRVRLGKNGQAIVGFPKFNTIGIGFAQEEKDWNTNLPFVCSTADIYKHIAHNKGNADISHDTCLEAIELVREAARRFEGLSDEDWEAAQAKVAEGRRWRRGERDDTPQRRSG